MFLANTYPFFFISPTDGVRRGIFFIFIEYHIFQQPGAKRKIKTLGLCLAQAL